MAINKSSLSLEVRRGPRPGTVLSLSGELLRIPKDWELLPPGDATLTRRVKAAGQSWAVLEIKRGKRYSHGVWAPAATIHEERRKWENERTKPDYKAQLEAGRQRRAQAEQAYADSFLAAVRAYLAFAPRYEQLERRLAELVCAHATPVGSGTVARTRRLSLSAKAEAATIAWMRHQTTGYDQMNIPKVSGARRETRRELAHRSKELLKRYREGISIDSVRCPLRVALRRLD